MSMSMYQASVPLFTQLLGGIKGTLVKTKAHVEAKNIEASALLEDRLFPDMFKFSRQVQQATDMACGVARIAGVDVPTLPTAAASFDDLIARVDAALAFLGTLKPAQIDGAEAKDVTITMRNGPRSFTGQSYLMTWLIPHTTFHATTAYNILRHRGVEIGKRDFLG
ncbi:MAG: DUF1993 domain-containing protein [Acetobacteraceae bacterium]|nr:DUF1993 domain-containing protein [Acetobacteraceae bacterium]MSP29338.1 DUF1993 domain-containing protein [Acetobacteraceae bacterium]